MEAALNGPDGRTLLETPLLAIGRHPQNQLVIKDVKTSSHHAEIRQSAQGYSLVDLGSTNGTYVNEQKIAPNVPLLLKANDRIRIGDTRFAYEISGVTRIDATVRDQTGLQNILAYQSSAAAVPPPPPNVQPPASPGPQSPAMPSPYTGYQAGALPPPPPNVQPPASPGFHPPAMPSPYASYQAGSMPPPPPMPGPQQPAPSFATTNVGQWLHSQKPKKYWRVFLVGLIAYVITQAVMYQTVNLNLVPLVILLASSLVPVTFVLFCWEQGAASADIPLSTIGLVFASGASMGLIVAVILESTLLGSSNGLGSWLVVGLSEEAAKVIALVWFMRNPRLSGELRGLILGVTSGMGFAALETAGYGFNAFLHAYTATGGNLGAGLNTMINELNLRMALRSLGTGSGQRLSVLRSGASVVQARSN